MVKLSKGTYLKDYTNDWGYDYAPEHEPGQVDDCGGYMNCMVSSQEGMNMITVEYANEIAEAAAQAEGILKEVAVGYLQDKIRQYPDPLILNRSGKANMHIVGFIQREVDLRKSGNL